MNNKELKPCKVQWCLAKKTEYEYQIKSTSGICLEEVGVPSKGTAVINRTIKPQVGDLVWCNNEICSLSGFIKQVKSFDGEEMIVQTRYRDHSKNYSFYCFEFYGVVELLFDSFGDLCYKRSNNKELLPQ